MMAKQIANLQCGQNIRHSVLGLGFVIGQRHGTDCYQHKHDYFEVMFDNDTIGRVRLFTEESIDNFIQPLQKGDDKMVKLNMSIEQREYFVNILKNAMQSQLVFADITYNQAEYDKAYNELLKLGLKDDVIDTEDVLVQIMLDNNSITLIETNNPCKHELTMYKLLEAVNSFLYNHKTINTVDELEEYGSYKDNEDILQIAVFGEIYF